MLFNIAWRNIWRTKGPTKVTMILTIWSMVILSAFMSMLAGTFDKQYDDTINLYPGYIHIEHPKFEDEKSYDNLLFDVKSIQEKLKKIDTIALSTVRLETFFLFSSKDNSAGSMLVGVQPSLESKMTTMHRLVRNGRFLEDNDTNGVVIGSSLAKKLHLTLGSTVSIVGTDVDYSFAADNLKVVGIFTTGVEGYDANAAFINKTYLDTLVNTTNIASHIILKPKDVDDSLNVAKQLRPLIESKNVAVLEWHTYMSTVIDSLQLIKVSRGMLIFFIIGIIFAVITIFAMLTLLSRTKEIGLMRSLGTTPKQIVGIILLERMTLTTISVTIGSVISFALVSYIHYNPISFDFGTNYAHSIGFMELVFITKIGFEYFVNAALMVFSFSLVSILYPIWYLSRLKPLDAMSK